MKILLVSSFLPYPLYSGGHIRLFNIIKGLSKEHKITLVCEKRPYQTEEDVKELEKFCEKVITIDRRKQWSIQNILKTGFSGNAFLITGHTNRLMKLKIKELLDSEKFDLIHVETFYVYQNVPKTSLPIVLIEHNIEYLVYKRFADNATLPLRPFLYIDVLKLKYWEEKMWGKATKLVAVSETEKKIMDKKRQDVVIVSNGVDTQKFNPPAGGSEIMNQERRILFIGEFKWVQNRDAIEWILKEIWPLINVRFKMYNLKLRLWIVGRNIPQDIKTLGGENVIFDENAPKETELIYQKSTLLLAPIRVGGGTSFKILEAMASGVPVITTSLGNAIDAKDNLEIVIAQTPQDFIQNIKKLLEDEKFYEKISINARKLVEKKFNWKIIVKKLESVYESVVF